MPFKISNPWILEHPAEVTDVQWLIVSTIGFVLVAFIFYKFVLLGMIAPHLKDRTVAIEEADRQVQQTLAETEQLRNDYRQRLERIEEETQQRMTAAIREAENLRDQILADGREHAAALVRRSEEEIAHERAKSMLLLRKKFVEDTIHAAQYAASRSLAPQDQSRLVAGFIQELNGTETAPSRTASAAAPGAAS